MRLKNKIFTTSLLLTMLLQSSFSQANPASYTKSSGDLVRFATYNLSFDRQQPEMLKKELQLTQIQQDKLLEKLENKDPSLTDSDKITVQHIQQIRNVSEIIQRTRPDVLVLNEFDNEGTGEDISSLKYFNENYLAYAQHENVKPISYPAMQSFATNTGLQSGFDLNNDGKTNDGPADAWGFGLYHGQYAFALLSQYPIDSNSIRTFQKSKWKDMPDEINPIIDDCDNLKASIPANRKCGDNWYSNEAWNNFPLSSKNHVDVSININNKIIHLLLSHPTPPVFNNAARHNLKHNRAEIKFWNDYISGKDYMIDDKGQKGGIKKDAQFIIAGDLNADSIVGDGDKDVMIGLMNHPLINQAVSNNKLIPTSQGGVEYLKSDYARRNQDRPHPEQITHSAGMHLDYILPSANINAIKTGVFWPTSREKEHYLVYKKINEKVAVGKKVSSDHRLVWLDFKLTN